MITLLEVESGGIWRIGEEKKGNQLGNWLGFGLRGGEGERGGLAGDRVRL